MKKPKSKQTEPENLSKRVRQTLDEVDWDLLDEMDLEDEGQPLPMQDYQGPAKSQSSPEPLSDNSRQTIFGKMEGSKKKGPKDSDHWHWKVRQGTPKT